MDWFLVCVCVWGGSDVVVSGVTQHCKSEAEAPEQYTAAPPSGKKTTNSNSHPFTMA